MRTDTVLIQIKNKIYCWSKNIPSWVKKDKRHLMSIMTWYITYYYLWLWQIFFNRSHSTCQNTAYDCIIINKPSNNRRTVLRTKIPPKLLIKIQIFNIQLPLKSHYAFQYKALFPSDNQYHFGVMNNVTQNGRCCRWLQVWQMWIFKNVDFDLHTPFPLEIPVNSAL